MKKILLTVAFMVVALFVARLDAKEATVSKPASPDWHYRWHEGRWWYWMPNHHWMVWTDSYWVPYEKFSNCANTSNVGQAKSPSATYAGYETRNEGAASEPADSGGGNWQPGSGYPGGSGSGYAGYGWTWGPGTAFRDGPGSRF